MTGLFDSYRLGNLRLSNRIVMAPLTRNRAGAGNVPTALMAEYYAQRAGAGLIVAEATQVVPEGQGYQDTPGIHSAEQVAGWKRVTDAVHAGGGRIFLQLWHVGRVSHVDLQPGGQAPVAPSAIRAKTKTFVGGTFTDVSEPRALRLDEIPAIVDGYRKGAANAVAAGFDGVEIHGANGYLLDQFLRDGINQRTDAYGGSIENRARLLLEVTEAIVKEIGADRTAIRISPVTPANDAVDSNPQPLFNYVVEQLDRLGLVYIHVIEGSTGGPRDNLPFDYGALRSRYRGAWIANNGYDRAMAENAVVNGRADLIAFGRPFISNPDLVERLRNDAPLAQLNRTTLYGGGAEGYTDYPALSAVAAE
ncbi:alkene reductase [Ferrovibrio sp.]|uniref:alkene reductase n=1 Tax=Ferrovibrio sp. TaxID=1917215 RepID=UPI000CB96800|nr:alkene reductase [Ferrovibrio sp.]PJI40994.1 MAG: alkene reductase [Ferrovibrio sp.]